MWDAGACLSTCFRALTKVNPDSVSWQQLVEVQTLLPEGLSQSPQQAAWESTCRKIASSIVKEFADVQALVTSAQQLHRFREFPFIIIKAWAASDSLFVDSEDSVAVALDWWAGGSEGRKCSEQQFKDLAGLLRVKHLSPGMCLHLHA
jgi:hypothetical protein